MKRYSTKVVGSRIKLEVEAPKEERSSGGIIVATDIQNKEDHEIGKVVQLGHLAYANFEETGAWCKVGDRIFFQRYAGKPREEIGPDGKPGYYRIIKDIDVIAIIEEEETGNE